MKHLIAAALLLALAAPSTASADPSPAEARVSVKTGLWEFNQVFNVAGIKKTKVKKRCLNEEKATMTLAEMAHDLNKGCRAERVVAITDGYSFRLVCTGEYTGEANGTLVARQETLGLAGKGSASVIGIPAGFAFDLNARRVGACEAR